ncbi:MAG: hypothetical protein PCFJNLEI_00894 [Verrucomicrobiae bacterium]|nr:hypothetical protein [Verrucomicrobiae bacterium]
MILEIESQFDQWRAFALQYGHATNPYVNITDARDLPLPVFGPWPLKAIAGSRFITQWQVAPVPGDALALEYSRALLRRGWQPAPVKPVPAVPELVMPALPTAPRTGSYLFQTELRSPCDRAAELLLGADSPLQIWCNGTRVFCDSQLTNPALPDQCFVPVTLRRGANEIVIAFDARGGTGWGFMLRVGPESPKPRK